MNFDTLFAKPSKRFRNLKIPPNKGVMLIPANHYGVLVLEGNEHLIYSPGKQLEGLKIEHLIKKGVLPQKWEPTNQCAKPLIVDDSVKSIISEIIQFDDASQNEIIAKILYEINRKREKKLEESELAILRMADLRDDQKNNLGQFKAILSGDFVKRTS